MLERCFTMHQNLCRTNTRLSRRVSVLRAQTWASPWCPCWGRWTSRWGWRSRRPEGRARGRIRLWRWCSPASCWVACPSPGGRWAARTQSWPVFCGWSHCYQTEAVLKTNREEHQSIPPDITETELIQNPWIKVWWTLATTYTIHIKPFKGTVAVVYSLCKTCKS